MFRIKDSALFGAPKKLLSNSANSVTSKGRTPLYNGQNNLSQSVQYQSKKSWRFRSVPSRQNGKLRRSVPVRFSSFTSRSVSFRFTRVFQRRTNHDSSSLSRRSSPALSSLSRRSAQRSPVSLGEAPSALQSLSAKQPSALQSLSAKQPSARGRRCVKFTVVAEQSELCIVARR